MTRLATALVLALLGATLLAACGGGSKTSTQTTASPSTSTTGTAPSTTSSAAAAQQQAASSCKAAIQAQAALPTSVKSQLEGVCDKAASAKNPEQLHKAAEEACAKLISSSGIPNGPVRDQIVAACSKIK